MRNESAIWNMVEAHGPDLTGLADRVWAMPETLYNEYRSCAEHTAVLRQKGFRVSENVAGIPTAVMGEAGQGGPLIAILGEYDALPGLSQVAGVDYPQELEPGGNGHGCGHNLLGSAALLAATALKDWLEATGTPGRVRYYGCPAEEGGAAKTFMVREGAFAGVDAAITWHPDSMTRVDDALSLANTRMDFTFKGRAAHAAAAPHLGRSALDAVELTSVGVNYLREHVPQDARIHYAYLEAGGSAPNVVQARAKVRYSIRALRLADMLAIVERVKDVARGAALMTGTEVEMKVFSAVSNMLGNAVMERTMQAALDELGGVPFDAADRDYAARIQATLGPADLVQPYRRVGMAPRTGESLCDYVVGLYPQGEVMIGSTDVADVSWAVPLVQALVATHAIGTPAHSWQITAQGKAGAAHKGMVHAAKAMARCAEKLFADRSLLAAARAEHAERLAREPYVCPMPADVQPPLVARPLMRWNGPLRRHRCASVVVVANATRRDRSMEEVTTIGLDLAKQVFQVHGATGSGMPVFNRKLRRAEVLRFFQKLPPCLVGMEACASSHHWAREISALGHDVRLIPPQYVKPFVKRGKTDAADAEAICEAVTRPTMRFVPVKSAEQQASVMVLRTRALLVRERTQSINALRGHLGELGIIASSGVANTKTLAAVIRDEEDARLPRAARFALMEILETIEGLSARIERLEREIVAEARRDTDLRRLATIPGVGPIIAMAVKAFVPDPGGFASARHFAAWIGLTPKAHSSGGKERLGRISKMGNAELRSLLTSGATSVLRHVRDRERVWPWLKEMLARRPFKVVAIALANKIARTIWALLTAGGTYRAPIPTQGATMPG